MKFEDAKKELLKTRKEKTKIEYDLPFEIAEMIIDARVKLGITQAELAQLVGTKQPSIARLENGTSLPSLSFLSKIAEKLGTYLIAPKFAFLDDTKIEKENSNNIWARVIVNDALRQNSEFLLAHGASTIHTYYDVNHSTIIANGIVANPKEKVENVEAEESYACA